MDDPLLWEVDNAARTLHASRGPLHRLLWHTETSKGLPCAECDVTARDILDQFIANRPRIDS